VTAEAVHPAQGQDLPGDRPVIADQITSVGILVQQRGERQARLATVGGGMDYKAT